MNAGRERRTLYIAIIALALPLSLSGCARSPAALGIEVDPRAQDSFLALCRAYPPPPGLVPARRAAGLPARDPAARLSFGKSPRGENEKPVSDYRLYPVKRCWERSPEDKRSLPLAGIELPDCVWVEGLEGAGLEEELVLSISPDAPSELKRWFSGIPASTAPPLAWIAAVGDLMMGRGVEGILLSGPEGGRKVFGDLLPTLRGADFLIGNLEGALTEGGRQAAKLYTFRFPPATASALEGFGFDYLSLSNNHSFDFGARGFVDSLRALRAAGLGCSGAGMDLKEASEPFRARAKGQELSITAFGAFRLELPRSSVAASASHPGILLKEEGLAAIRASAGPAFDIAVAHAGTEYADAPGPSVRELYRDCVDSGADVVLGSHPHVLQGIEAYRGRLIAYSLGNFVFRGMEGMANATDTMVLRLGLAGGRVVAVEPLFARIGPDGPRLAPASSGDRFYALSRALAGLPARASGDR